MTYRTGSRGSGGATPEPSAGGVDIGFFDYRNTLPDQYFESTVWNTIKNNALGPQTELRFAPKGVTSMLDTATGRILLSGLAIGDQVYVRHTLSVLGYVNNMSLTLRNYFGQTGQEYVEPFGPTIRLQSGAGVQSGLQIADSRFYVRDENTRLGGVLPQIKGDNRFEVQYSGVYISVIRKSS